VDQSVRERWITESDGRKIKAELKVSAEPKTIGPPVNTSGAFR
jgi:hypothetical protein